MPRYRRLAAGQAQEAAVPQPFRVAGFCLQYCLDVIPNRSGQRGGIKDNPRLCHAEACVHIPAIREIKRALIRFDRIGRPIKAKVLAPQQDPPLHVSRRGLQLAFE